MLIRRHKISDEIFFAIASGGGGFSAVDHLATVEYSKHLLLLRGILEISRESRHPQYDHASRAYDLLARIQDRQPSAVSTVIRHPAVGAWARRTVIALQGGEMRPGAQPAGLASIAAAAAIRSRFSCSIEVPVVSGAVMLPSLGQVTVSNPGSRSGPCVIRSSPREAELSGAGRRVLILEQSVSATNPRMLATARSLIPETYRVDGGVIVRDEPFDDNFNLVNPGIDYADGYAETPAASIQPQSPRRKKIRSPNGVMHEVKFANAVKDALSDANYYYDLDVKVPASALAGPVLLTYRNLHPHTDLFSETPYQNATGSGDGPKREPLQVAYSIRRQ